MKAGYMRGAIVAAGALSALLFGGIVAASASISQGYAAIGDIAAGMLVSRVDSAEGVRSSQPGDEKQIVGVATSGALLEISSGQQQVQVATSGTVEALVTTMNGDVKAGDHVTPSPVNGVGMLATESSYIVGVASSDFSKARNVTEREITDKDGNTHAIKVGLLPVEVGVGYYEKTENKSLLPEFISNLARTIAGREVTAARVIAAGAILVVGLCVVVVLVSSTARSSIISIGRNPLAARAVHRGLLEASGLAIGILLVVLIAVYLILVT